MNCTDTAPTYVWVALTVLCFSVAPMLVAFAVVLWRDK